MAVKVKKRIEELWEEIFDDFNIDAEISKNGFFEISADDIRAYKEPRLMTKFDNSSALPTCFWYNKKKKEGKHLSILPTSRGKYIIGAFDAYNTLDKSSGNLKRVHFPSKYETLSINSINSEATALNVAYVSGILKDFIEDDNLMPTVNGRMASGNFHFDMTLDKTIVPGKGTLTINIQNSQIEIDGGYEGDNTLSLIEAKNIISDDFLVRQVYFPYRTWDNKINKSINNVFMTYSNETYHLYQYQFEDIASPESIKLVKRQSYTFNPPLDLEMIVDIAQNIKLVKEPQVPFPQADDFNKVLALCESLNRDEMEENYEPLTKVGVAIKFGFHLRQADYYINAAKYLGFIEIVGGRNSPICLTRLGKEVFSLPSDEKNKKIVEAILAHEVFNKCFKEYLKYAGQLESQKVVAIMTQCKVCSLDDYSMSTYKRRASSVLSWINWIVMLTKESIDYYI